MRKAFGHWWSARASDFDVLRHAYVGSPLRAWPSCLRRIIQLNIADIQTAGQDILRLLNDYKHMPSLQREMRLDPVLYGFLEARFGKMSRQHKVRMHSKQKAQRIDFRYGGSNPVVIEFAVRTSLSSNTLYGSQNSSELKKLTRIIPSQASLRILLLLDLASSPLAKPSLESTYNRVTAGRGNFKRHSVRVVYVHAFDHLSFPVETLTETLLTPRGHAGSRANSANC